MKKLLFIPLFILMAWGAQAQEMRLNWEIQTPAIRFVYNFNFEHLLKTSATHNFGYRAGIGTSNRFINQYLTLEGVYYYGQRHQLELAPGITFGANLFKRTVHNVTYEPYAFQRTAPFLRIGYVWNTNKKLIFKAGVTPSYLFEPAGKRSTLDRFQYLNPYIGIGIRL